MMLLNNKTSLSKLMYCYIHTKYASNFDRSYDLTSEVKIKFWFKLGSESMKVNDILEGLQKTEFLKMLDECRLQPKEINN